jgi:hypothetical protein
MAGYRWFVDWEWGLSQRQYLEYVTHRPFRPEDFVLRRVWAQRAQADPSGLLPLVRPEDQQDAQLMLKIARNPQTQRYGYWTKAPRHQVRWYLRRLHRSDPGSYPFFYVYRLRHTGCAHRGRRRDGPITPGFNGGGLRDARAYRRWIRALDLASRANWQ